MITIIRKQLIENKAYKVMVWGMLILMIVSLGLPSLVSQSSQRNSWIALVNDIPIEYEDYSRRVADYENRLSMLKRQFGDSFMNNINPHSIALNSLIRNELLGQIARTVPVVVDEEVVHDKLADTEFVYQELADIVPSYVVDPSTGINDAALQNYLRTAHIAPTEFHHKVVDSIQRSLIKNLVTLSAYTPSTQLKEQYMHEYAGKKFSVLTVSLNDCLQQVKKKGVTAEELQAFFDAENKASRRYYVAERRGGIVATMHARDYGIVPSDEDIKHYYNEHKKEEFVDKQAQVQVRHLVVETTEQAEKIRAELIQQPALFEKKVAEYSIDAETKKSGGLLAPFTRNGNEMGAERAAFLLKQDGDISEVIPTAQGFEILQRVKRIPPTFIPLEHAKKSIRTRLTQTAFATAFNNDMLDLAQKTETERGALDQYVATHKGSIVEHPLTNNDNSVLMTQLFNLKQGQSTYYVEGDTATIVMLTRIEPAHIPEFSAVRQRVETDYYAHKAQELLQDTLKTVAASANSSYEELRSAHHLVLTNTSFIRKSDEKSIEPWKNKGLPVAKMLQLEKVGMVTTFSEADAGYIVRLDEISPLNEQDFELHKKDLCVKLERENAQSIDAGFVASLYRHATIKQNDSLSIT